MKASTHTPEQQVTSIVVPRPLYHLSSFNSHRQLWHLWGQDVSKHSPPAPPLPSPTSSQKKHVKLTQKNPMKMLFLKLLQCILPSNYLVVIYVEAVHVQLHRYFLVSHLLLQYSSIEGIGNSMGIERLVKSEAFVIWNQSVISTRVEGVAKTINYFCWRWEGRVWLQCIFWILLECHLMKKSFIDRKLHSICSLLVETSMVFWTLGKVAQYILGLWMKAVSRDYTWHFTR